MADSKISALTDGTTPATTDASPWARSGGTTVKLTWAEMKAAMPGSEIGYDQITSNVNIASTTEASGTTIITCAAHVFDGAAAMATFFTPIVFDGTSAGSTIVVSLFESSTQIGRLVSAYVAAGGIAVGVSGMLRFTPSAASHTYAVTAYVSSLTGTPSVTAGAGGTATYVPSFIRFTKV